LPAPIRLTHLGISSVPKPLIVGGEAFGANPRSFYGKWSAERRVHHRRRKSHSCIMLSLSMVIAAWSGPAARSPGGARAELGAGGDGFLKAGFTIVLLAIILDRMSRPKERGVFPVELGRGSRTSISCSPKPGATDARVCAKRSPPSTAAAPAPTFRTIRGIVAWPAPT